MLLTWGEYKTVIRRTMLKNDLTGITWTDEALLDAVGWALNGLCVHTALQKSTAYTGDGNTYQFTLPTDVFVPLEQAGLVMLLDGETQLLTYLKPAYNTFDVAATDEFAFSTWLGDTLETGVPVPIGVSLIVRYYGYYPFPTSDASIMTIPQWAYAAVAYSTVIHALTSESLVEASNKTDLSSPDRGQPENNSMRQLQKWWIQLYDRELAQYPKQNRIASLR